MKNIYRFLLWITCLYLLYIKTSYGIIIGLTLILGELALNLDLIEILKFGSNIIKLKELKKEVYASIEIVKELALEISKATSYSLSRVGKFAPTDLNERLIEERTTIYNLLTKLKIDNEEINKTLRHLDESISARKAKKTGMSNGDAAKQASEWTRGGR